jgi:hypothetical protein
MVADGVVACLGGICAESIDAVVLGNASGALANVSLNEQSRGEMAQAGVASSLSDLCMRYAESDDDQERRVLQNASSVICSLAKHPPNRELLQCAVGPLILLLGHSSKLIVKNATSAMENLSSF